MVKKRRSGKKFVLDKSKFILDEFGERELTVSATNEILALPPKERKRVLNILFKTSKSKRKGMKDVI